MANLCSFEKKNKISVSFGQNWKQCIFKISASWGHEAQGLAVHKNWIKGNNEVLTDMGTFISIGKKLLCATCLHKIGHFFHVCLSHWNMPCLFFPSNVLPFLCFHLQLICGTLYYHTYLLTSKPEDINW